MGSEEEHDLAELVGALQRGHNPLRGRALVGRAAAGRGRGKQRMRRAGPLEVGPGHHQHHDPMGSRLPADWTESLELSTTERKVA